MASILEAHVVLVRPEVGQPADQCVTLGDRHGDAAPVMLGHLPVLDANGLPQHRVWMERDVSSAVDMFGGAQSLVHAYSGALELQAECSWHIEVGLDADGNQQ